jgi:tetratricopeptide (TPR) repeat protein
MTRISACLLVLLTSTASAQHARFPRDQPTPEPPVLSERVQPAAPRPASSAQKPTLGMDDVLSIEGLKSPIRTEQEQILAQLIDSTPDSEAEEKADYYFRLGELYAKQHRYWRIKTIELAANPREANLAASKSKEYLLKTVKAYKGLTDNEAFRTYPKLDLALFYYGYTLQSGKYMKEARAVYDKLLKNYPNSKLVPEAHLAFADYYFESGQLADADARYKQVLKFPKGTAYVYALYKLGWVHLMLERNQEAIEAFFRVVSATRNDAKQAALHAAARNDFVRAYSKIGKLDKAQDVFARLDGAKATELVELIADIARDSGTPQRAIAVYRELLAKNRQNPRSCEWQYQIARTTLSLPDATAAAKVTEIEALVKTSTSVGTKDAECQANASAMSSEIAATFHAEWATTKDAAALQRAEQLYAAHVAAFPGDAAARDTYAEVLWTRADLEQAPAVRAQLWQRSAEVFASDASLQGARAAALAWMNALDIELETTVVLGKTPRSRPRAKPLDAKATKAIAALAAYVKLGPEADSELAAMRLTVATILRRHHRYDEAVTALDGFLEHHPDDARAEVAANLLLDSMIQAKRPDDLRDVVEAIAADTDFVEGKPELKKNLLVLRSLR